MFMYFSPSTLKRPFPQNDTDSCTVSTVLNCITYFDTGSCTVNTMYRVLLTVLLDRIDTGTGKYLYCITYFSTGLILALESTVELTFPQD